MGAESEHGQEIRRLDQISLCSTSCIEKAKEDTWSSNQLKDEKHTCSSARGLVETSLLSFSMECTCVIREELSEQDRSNGLNLRPTKQMIDTHRLRASFKWREVQALRVCPRLLAFENLVDWMQCRGRRARTASGNRTVVCSSQKIGI